LLTWIGGNPAEGVYIKIGQAMTFLYFFYFFLIFAISNLYYFANVYLDDESKVSN
jgi:hypothetical protein